MSRVRSPRAPRFRSRIVTLTIVLLGLGISAPRSAGATASITSDGMLLVEGERMFPIGLVELGTYEYLNWDQRIRNSGANLVWDIEIAYADTTPGCAEVMQAAHDGGYYLMLGSGDTWNWDDWSTPELEVDQMMYEPEEFETLLDCVAAHPERVVAWANRDEPVWTVSRNQVGDIDEPHIRATYEQLHERLASPIVTMNFAPAHLSMDPDTWKADIASYASATDIMLFAAYPYPAGPGTCTEVNVLGYPECAMDRLVQGVDVFLSELTEPGQPLWMIIQAHKAIPLKESRWEAWASIVHGATGVLWAGWTWDHWLGSGSASWPVIEQVMSEVSSLHPFLVGLGVPGAESDHPDVEVRALAAGEEVIVIAISRNGYSGPASINLPGLERRRVKVEHEDRHLIASGGVITDDFDGYEAHVYRYGSLADIRAQWSAVDAPVTDAAPDRFRLETFPNPSAGRTTVRFQLAREAAVVFTVYDTAGRKVATLGRGRYPAGLAEVSWNGRDLGDRPVAPGTYFVRGRTSSGEDGTARVVIRH